MKNSHAGFTLIELLVTIAIIALLIGLVAPQAGRIKAKADSAKCLNNLRQIGVSVGLYSADNNNRFPAIESMPSDPVYGEAYEDDPEKKPKPIYEVLSPYGVTKDTLKCASDVAKANYFAKEGSSYGWRNTVDDEIASAPKIYGRRGIRNPNASWLLLVTDYDVVHLGHDGQLHSNRLYADGHVTSK